MRSRKKAGKRIRILYYSHTGLVSGAEHVLLNTLAGLDRSIFEPVAVCPVEGDLKSRMEQTSIPVLSVNPLQARFTLKPLSLLRYLISFSRVILSFRSKVKEVAPDLIHANSVRSGLVATMATVVTRTPVVWHIHDDLPRHPISMLIRLGAYLSRRSIFLAVSASTSRIFCGGLPFGSRIHILHNGIDLRRFTEKQVTDLTFRTSLGIRKDAFLICAIGMINPRKDLLGLLRAVKLAHDRQPAIHLAIVGQPIFNRDDLYLDEVRHLTAELGLEAAVYFTGSLKDIPSVLRGCNLLVLNAKVEPFGLVLVEAMACGTPVLATRVGGIPEIVSDNETGFLVSPGDPAALASRLLQIIATPEKAAQVARNARQHLSYRFTIERYNKQYQDIVQSYLSLPKAGLVHPGGQPPSAPNLRVALFHDNFAQSGGAERVAEELHRTLLAAHPDTHLLTTLTSEDRLSPYLRKVNIRTTWMQHLPAKAKLFRAYFLLYPFAVDHVDVSAYDLIITSCFGYAKGVQRRPGSLHICYCHAPMRWVWRTEDYLSREKHGVLKKLALSLPIRWLRQWELQAAARPDVYIANSSVVADRLFQAFGVHATVIPPPIDTKSFALQSGMPSKPDDFYLVLSRLVPYKRLDLAIEACTRTQRKLIVIGDGPDRKRLEGLAGPTVSFLGRASRESVIDHAQRCRGLLFPGEEDFGMTPLEINAAGRPVVAYHGGGATETIIDGLNGVFFEQPTPASMIAALDRMESMQWDSASIQRHAQQYDTTLFAQRIQNFIRLAIMKQKVNSALSVVPVNA